VIIKIWFRRYSFKKDKIQGLNISSISREPFVNAKFSENGFQYIV